MLNRRFLFGLAIIIFGFSGCKKEAMSIDCQKLKAEIASGHVEGVKIIIDQLIGSLPSKQYNEQNINELANQLKGECSLSAEVLCFDCIKTLPSQTEIQVSFSMQGSNVRKILDITYSTDNNQMKFGNMHE
jgi:hypothetical protein